MHKLLFLCSALIFSASFSVIASNSILVQSTTSTQNSGLFNYIVPIYQAKTGIEVKVVAVGTGQALKNAANGDADVVMVHAKSAEETFIKNGGINFDYIPCLNDNEDHINLFDKLISKFLISK